MVLAYSLSGHDCEFGFLKKLLCIDHVQTNWSTAITSSGHTGTPEIPLPESMAGQPSLGKRTLLQSLVLAPHYLLTNANPSFSKQFFAKYHLGSLPPPTVCMLTLQQSTARKHAGTTITSERTLLHSLALVTDCKVKTPNLSF
jgi:hypothetical protein